MNFQNFKDWKTTIIGILTIIAVLPQSELVQQLITVSPKAANYVTGVAVVAGGILMIFGINISKK